MKRKILIADDEPRMLMLLRDFLSSEYHVIEASDGKEALDKFKDHPDLALVILDIMMPFLSGIEVMEIIKRDSQIPVMLLTAKNTELDELTGFVSGADDYVKKPFSPSILRARVNVLLKRHVQDEQVFIAGKLKVDLDKSMVFLDGAPLDVSATEFKLLVHFVKNLGITLSRDALLDSVWGLDYDGTDRTVDTTINRLRSKLTLDCDYIHTIRGLGYRFEVKP